MREIIKWTALLLVFVVFVSAVDLITDRQELHDSLIRLHVVGATDGQEDQAVKLLVRDAVNGWLMDELHGIHNAAQAREYLRTHLAQIEQVANMALDEAGVSDRVAVSFLEEEFPIRDYDTFSLPSGVYHSLRIRIGDAQGRNWWCVVFPTLCLGATSSEMKDAAVSAGFDEALTDTLTGGEGYEIRFFLLDCLGVLENFFHKG